MKFHEALSEKSKPEWDKLTKEFHQTVKEGDGVKEEFPEIESLAEIQELISERPNPTRRE